MEENRATFPSIPGFKKKKKKKEKKGAYSTPKATHGTATSTITLSVPLLMVGVPQTLVWDRGHCDALGTGDGC